MGAGGMKNEKQHLSGADRLYHALRPAKQTEKQMLKTLFNILPLEKAAAEFELQIESHDQAASGWCCHIWCKYELV